MNARAFKYLLACCMILFFGTGILSAQTMVTLQSGINSLTNSEDPSLLSQSWKSATSLATSVDFFVTKSIAIDGSFEFNSYPFDTYRYSGAGDIESIVKASSGDASQIYRISLESKVFAFPLGHFFLYLVTGASYTIQHSGQINLTVDNINGHNNAMVIPSQMNYYWMHSLGTGFRYYFLKDFGIDFTGKWYANYTTRSHLSAYLGVVYIL